MEDSEIKNEPKKTEKTAKTDKKKGGFFKALKGEFHRVVWPDRDTIVKETTAVVVVTVILGAVIALLDFVIRLGIDKIIQIG
ncbi:MAG: preprotein translocase subunit SecE [Lachnospiraceae bacterium]|nr:preprotein translocase subunit SecE [Lachnospiraceae bacterium]